MALPVVLRGAVCAAPDRGRRGLRAQVRTVDDLPLLGLGLWATRRQLTVALLLQVAIVMLTRCCVVLIACGALALA